MWSRGFPEKTQIKAEIRLYAKIIVTLLSCDIRILQSPKKIHLNRVQSMSKAIPFFLFIYRQMRFLIFGRSVGLKKKKKKKKSQEVSE